MAENQKETKPGVIAVNASAGTGKTYALSKYYLKLLLNSDRNTLKEIIAITFTKKATKEMKERIVEFIKEVAFETENSKEILGLEKIPPSYKKKAAEVMDFLVRNYNFFQVQTIDSFVNNILQSCAINLNLSSKYQTKTDNKEYLLYALESVIEKALEDASKKALFDEFLSTFLQTENKVSWFPKEEIFEVINRLNEKMNHFGKEFIKLERATSAEIRELKKSVMEDFDALSKILPKETNGTFKNSFQKFMDKGAKTFKSDEIPNGFGKEDFPVNKGGTVSAKVRALWDSLRRKIVDLCKKEAYSFFNCYIDIFQIVDQEFSGLSDKEDIMFLNEFNKRAGALFSSGQGILPELYYRLAARFKHFLIDEFQDTSTLQWENLKTIIDEILGTGGNLFYVGDKKQAIYGFRGGNAELFDEAREAFYKVDSKLEMLKVNYRSQKAIVLFNNNIFSEENLNSFFANEKIELSEKYKEDILKVFSGSRQEFLEKKSCGFVKTEFIDSEEDEEKEAKEKTIKIIKNCLQRGLPKNNIAVLCRTNKDVQTVTNWLLEEKYAVESEKTLSLRENGIIKELISLLMYLNSPIDNAAFASFITGEVFKKASNISSEELENFLFSINIKRSGNELSLYREFRRKYPDIWASFFELLFSSALALPFYEIAVSIYARFKVLENFGEQHIFLAKFLELIKDQSKENPGLNHFLNYFMEAEEKDLYINSAKADAVNVLTMHASKGLEFPVVIIPYFEISVKRGNEFYGITENGMVLVKLKEKYEKLAEDLQAYSMKNRKENIINELNTAYVAFTRAGEELYIMHSPKAGAHNNLAKAFLGEKDIETGKKQKYEKEEKKEESLIKISVPKYSDIAESLRDEYVPKDELFKREEFLYGKAVHLALSYIGNLKDKNKDIEAEKALRKAAAVYGKKSAGLWLKKIKSVLENKTLKQYFYVEKGEVYCEKEFINKNGETRIIDRLIVNKKEAVIIDYKSTSGNKEEHVRQVKEYRELLSEIYKDKTVKGLILYLDSETVAEV